ncbi:hypothetical protein RIF29_06391 [Crotalaria pallida]|uniref:CASP-like protein n=1 Tax=Crotalaria pallida TaxID=3830 RepID=A0AAN9PBH7_CROPI
MASKPVTVSMLLLRIIALLAAAATIALLVTNNVTYDDGTKMKFKDLISFRYVLAVATITIAYCTVQLPFSIYYAVHQKRLVRDGYLPEFDFYGDKVISVLLATGIGAGLAVSLEFKRFFDNIFDDAGVPKNDPTRSTNDKYLVRGIIASAVLSISFLSMFVVSVISSNNRNKSRGIFG